MMQNMNMDLDKISHFRRQHPYKYYMAMAAIVAAIILMTTFIVSPSSPLTTTPSAKTHSKTRNTFSPQRSYAQQYYVSPGGKDTNNGTSEQYPFQSIDKALSIAEAGNVIQLAEGRYHQTISTVKNGTDNKPITIQGNKNVVVYGSANEGRIVEIKHDYVTLKGFTIDGLNGTGDRKEDYRDKLIYVIGGTDSDGVTGLKITNMTMQNAGGECIRLRYFATNNEVSDSVIKTCGVYDFKFNGGGKNGEGIYIGTAPEQRNNGRNPTSDIDRSDNNRIFRNAIDTYGNECVDVKEGSSHNIVEYNICQNQLDEDSAGFDARGSGNTFRYNTSQNNKGAGVRLGGDEIIDGINNNVYGNILENNNAGAIKILRYPQAKICENLIKYTSDSMQEKYDLDDFHKKCR
jgi:hypothetical protein